MQYIPKDTARRCDTLNLQINTVYDLPLDGELELNVTTKSNDQTGPGAIFSVTKRNIFGRRGDIRRQMRVFLRMADRQNGFSGSSSAINSIGVRYQRYADFPAGTFPQFDKA